MSSPLRLYIDGMSQPSRAVHILLLESSIPFTVVDTQIAKGMTRSKEYRSKVNPNGHVPALDDNGFVMFESHAIMQYLCNKYSSALPDHFYPRDPVARAKVDMFLSWHHANLRRGSSGLVFSTQFAKALGQMNDEQIARASKEGAALLKASLKRIEESYLPSADGFLMGLPSVSIADISAACELFMTQHLAGFDISAWPKVGAWLGRTIAALPNSWPKANATLIKVLKAREAKKAAAAAAAPTAAASSAASSSSSSSSSSAPAAASGSDLQAGVIFRAIGAQLSSPDGAEAIAKLQAVFKFVVTPAKGPAVSWVLDLKNSPGSVTQLAAGSDAKADATFNLSDDNFVALATSKLNPQVAFLGGKLKLQGNLAKAMAFNTTIFQKASIKNKINEAVKTLPIKAKL